MDNFFLGIVIAFSFAAPPGPVAMETIRRGLRGGFWPGFRVQLGSSIGDTFWCLLAVFGLAPVVRLFQLPVSLLGAALLFFLGFQTLRDAIRNRQPVAKGEDDIHRGSFRAGFAISLGNPMAVGYWVSIGSVLAANGIAIGANGQILLFGAGFLLCIFAWAIIMAWLTSAGKNLLGSGFFRWINAVCGTCLIYFGILLLANLLPILLSG